MVLDGEIFSAAIYLVNGNDNTSRILDSFTRMYCEGTLMLQEANHIKRSFLTSSK